MIVDQTIEKVSFCAPDRNHEKGFAYICRDGTTRRWMCHGFLAVKESVRNQKTICSLRTCLGLLEKVTVRTHKPDYKQQLNLISILDFALANCSNVIC